MSAEDEKEKRSGRLSRTPPAPTMRYCTNCRAHGHYAEDCPRKRRKLNLNRKRK